MSIEKLKWDTGDMFLNSLRDAVNEHSQELIRLHARITELTEDKRDARTLPGHCGGCGADVAHGVICVCNGSGVKGEEKEYNICQYTTCGRPTNGKKFCNEHEHKTLEDIICSWNNTRGNKQEYETLASAIRTHIKEIADDLIVAEPLNFMRSKGITDLVERI